MTETTIDETEVANTDQAAAPAADAPQELVPQTVRIRACIDGRSRLILDDDTARWQHFDFAAPGRNECNLGVPIEPTFVSGVEWWPQWPDLPDCENRFCGGCLGCAGGDCFGGKGKIKQRG